MCQNNGKILPCGSTSGVVIRFRFVEDNEEELGKTTEFPQQSTKVHDRKGNNIGPAKVGKGYNVASAKDRIRYNVITYNVVAYDVVLFEEATEAMRFVDVPERTRLVGTQEAMLL